MLTPEGCRCPACSRWTCCLAGAAPVGSPRWGNGPGCVRTPRACSWPVAAVSAAAAAGTAQRWEAGGP